MLVANWMTSDPVSVTAETSLMRASKIMKDMSIRTLPAVNYENHLAGVITDRDVKEASPSRATALEIHELYYLLSEVLVGDVMTVNPISIRPDDSVEKAAALLMDNKIGGLPVVDDTEVLVGIITQHDIFNALVSITGFRQGGFQLCIDLPDEHGSLGQLIALLNEGNADIISVLTAYESHDAPTRKVFFRLGTMEARKEKILLETLRESYTVLFVLKDTL